MDKEFYDKYSKDLECSCCQDLEHCINGKEPLKINCAIHYFKDKIACLETKLSEKEKEIEYQESMKILAVKNQSQTAIAELEKAKENMNNLYREHKPIYFDLLLIRNTIDQQITELKGGK